MLKLIKTLLGIRRFTLFGILWLLFRHRHHIRAAYRYLNTPRTPQPRA